VGSENQVKIRIDNLSLSFGGVKALIDVSLDIKDNEILAIIGPNGAGKTCLLNCINGFYKPQKGERSGQNLPEHRAIYRAKQSGQHYGGKTRPYETERRQWCPVFWLGSQGGD